ncbi:OLC1v1035870C1 [Oldenlandia corymbosa var. corymbosa]|uniref:OLC1v1035870C1 n=1 Tax=Oldenlandia corymbosa var. corymbosa TaxID=529605 RepID=A0AAV1CWI0_OLDCO|nr:OLC1v1035870C1 [Oldenlandia corymbosa var. corymbosa]
MDLFVGCPKLSIFLWLICSYVSYLGADSLFPESEIWTQFLDESTEGLCLDGLLESHPIEVCDPGYSSISRVTNFAQGAFVIQMLQGYLGAERFHVNIFPVLLNTI